MNPNRDTRCALIVDDERVMRQLLADSLARRGFESTHAEDGASALRALSEGRFDLAFIDLHMPILDGMELLRLMRARGNETPFVVLSGSNDLRLVASAVKLGASDYLAKPFSDADVTAVLDRIFAAVPERVEVERAADRAASPVERQESSTKEPAGRE